MRRVRLAHVAKKTLPFRPDRRSSQPFTTCTTTRSDHHLDDAEDRPGGLALSGSAPNSPDYQSGQWRRQGWSLREKEKDAAELMAEEMEERDTEQWQSQFSVYGHKFHRRTVQAKNYVRLASSYPECGIGFVSLSPQKGQQTLPPFDSFWNVNFAAISARYNLAYPKSLRVADLFVNDEVARRAFHKLVPETQTAGGELEAIRHKWSSSHIFPRSNGKLHWWPSVMLWLLCNMPNFAAKFLLASYVEPYPPFYMVANSLEYLASHYFLSAEEHSVVAVESFRAIFYILLDSCAASRPYISQKTIYLLVTHSTTEQTAYLYEALQKAGVPLHHETLLHFANAYAQVGEFQKALDALEAAVVVGADPLSDSFLATCNKTLHYSVLHPDGYHATSHIVSQFLKLGSKMNQKLYNVLIVNALAANDMATALGVFLLLDEKKVEIGNVTYSILLNGYKHMTDAAAEFEATVVRKAHECVLHTRDPWLATEILHCTYLHYLKSDKDNPIAIFNSTLAAYTRYFKIWPLRILRIESRQAWQASRNEDQFDASTAAINIVLTAYLRAYPERARLTFNHFSAFFEMVVNSGPHSRTKRFRIMRQFLMDDYTYNIFLMALSQDVKNLQTCTSLVQQMGKTLPPHLLFHDPQTGEHREAAQPTVRTWSILLHAFARHGQVAAAEKVMELMRKRGMVETVVTWNSLVKGYVLRQDIPGTVDALGRMEREGFDADGYTTSTLKRIRDEEGLIKAWKERRGDREQGGLDSMGNRDGDEGLRYSEVDDAVRAGDAQQGYQSEETGSLHVGFEHEGGSGEERDGMDYPRGQSHINDQDPDFPLSPSGGVL